MVFVLPFFLVKELLERVSSMQQVPMDKRRNQIDKLNGFANAMLQLAVFMR